jgi:hypothetical protein
MKLGGVPGLTQVIIVHSSFVGMLSFEGRLSPRHFSCAGNAPACALHLAATGDQGFKRRLRLGQPLLQKVRMVPLLRLCCRKDVCRNDVCWNDVCSRDAAEKLCGIPPFIFLYRLLLSLEP